MAIIILDIEIALRFAKVWHDLVIGPLIVAESCPGAANASGWSFGQRSSTTVATSAAAHTASPPATSNTASPPASTRPAAIGASPRSTALCHGEPRQRPHIRAAP